MNKIWRDPVWSTVIAAGIIAAISYFAGFWPSIWRAVTIVYSHLVSAVSLPLWLVLFAIPVLLFTIPYLKSLRPNREPRFVSYTNDEIFDINWSWRWGGPTIYDPKYQILDLTPRCPSCHAVLSINNYSSPIVSCINEKCSWQWERQRQHGSRIKHRTELDAKVRNEIDRKIHAGERGCG